jgi:pimeloyl-ACP methyl ester carboxylesterase
MKLTIDGTSVTYDDRGSGPVLLLIHGFPLNRQMWQPQLLPLSEDGFLVIAPDLPGFGASDPPKAQVSMERFADALIALLDALRIEQAVVGGMSMGGYILMNLLERYPKRVRAACFIATKSSADSEAGRARRSALAAEACQLGAGPIIKVFAELLFTEQTVANHQDLVERVTSWMRDTDPRSLAGALLAMGYRKDSTPLLPQFNLPCLAIAGREDRALSPDALELLTSGLSCCQSAIIANAGHMVNMERPKEFNAVLLQFMKSLPETI